MATTHRQQSFHLKDWLFNAPYYFEFHQAVMILERLYPNASRLGETPYTENEFAFLSSHTAYSYSPSDINNLEYSNKTLQPLCMQVNFFGLAGINGPLPMPFTEQLVRDLQNHDYAMQDFIDIFNHRLLSLFHRIRKKYWVGLANCSPENSSIARILYSLCGLNLNSSQNKLHVNSRSLLYYTSVFWQQPASSTGLNMILSDYFNMPVTILPWQGRWLDIDKDQRTSLGQAHHRLGHTATLGKKFWDHMRNLQLRLGPLSFEQMQDFLPNGQSYDALKLLIQAYLGCDYNVRYQLELNGSDVPKLVLGNNTRLGWTTWLHHQTILKNQIITIS